MEEEEYFPNITIVKEAIYQLSLLFQLNLLISEVMGLKKPLNFLEDGEVMEEGRSFS